MKTARCFLRMFVLVVIVMPTGCRPRPLVASDPTLNSVSEPGSWQTYGYDLGHSFFSTEDAPPPQGEIAWQYGKPGDVFAPPLFKDNVLYVLYGMTCTAVALDANTGAEIWARRLDPDCPQARSLSLAGKILYVSIDGIISEDEEAFSPWVYALDKDSGEVLWQRETCSSWPFYVSQGLGYQINFARHTAACEKAFPFIEIYDAATGEKLEELSLSFLQSSDVPLLFFDDQRIYLRQDEYIYALDQKTYERVWEKHIEDLRGTKIINDKLYVGGREAFFILATQTGEELRAIEHPHTWGNEDGGIAAVAYDMILSIQSIDHIDTIYALSMEQGEVLWEHQLDDEIETPLIVANGRLYFGNTFRDEDQVNHSKLYALDIATGEVMWVLDTPPIRYNAPIIVDGVLYVGSYTGEVLAIR